MMASSLAERMDLHATYVAAGLIVAMRILFQESPCTLLVL